MSRVVDLSDPETRKLVRSAIAAMSEEADKEFARAEIFRWWDEVVSWFSKNHRGVPAEDRPSVWFPYDRLVEILGEDSE